MEMAEPEAAQLGRYQIESTLGAGGMGIVYLAQDTRLQRKVAIKKLRHDAASESAHARIQSEAQLLAKLNHPNIVQLYDVLEESDGIALVMEYVEGTTLREWMREHSAPLRDKLGLLMQICQGLSEAHSLGIIHRDLKPDNILITFNGTAKISDFGIAKSQSGERQDITRENHTTGTVSAMSPEQIQGKPLDHRSDLFSLGTIAYELLCGIKPFDYGEGGSLALASRMINEPHTPPQQAWAQIPEPLAVLLDKLLSKNPKERPESAQLVCEALEFLYQQGTSAGTEEFSATVTQLLRKPPSRRRHTLRTLAGAAGFTALCVAGYFGWEYATRLEPQYIAVLPVEINGEVRGEDNAKALTATMVRQALMNATSQLKASALVSFTPKEGQDFDAQLQALRDKGVTDALFARLECAQVRCEIELQRIGPKGSRIKQQTSFAFLADKRQEAEYRIGNSATALFPSSYAKTAGEQVVMSNTDYADYLNITSRLESKENSAEDLARLENLSASYPQNHNLYRMITQLATDLFVLTDEQKYLQTGLDIVERAKDRGIDPGLVLELELWLRTYSSETSAFNNLVEQLDDQDSPPAALLAKYARFFYMQGDYESGLGYAKEAAALNPSADNLYLIAINQTASGNYDNARTTISNIMQSYPEHWSSYSLLGVIELESGNLVEAESAIIAIPEDLRGWRTKSNLGVIHLLQRHYEAALREFLNVSQVVPNDPGTIGQIAETYLLMGEDKAARKSYLKLLEIIEEEEGLEANQFKAVALANLGREGEAIELINAMLQAAPDDTYVQYAAAQIYALAGEIRSASYHVDNLLKKGMSAEWFNLPVFRQICTQPQVSKKVKAAICD